MHLLGTEFETKLDENFRQLGLMLLENSNPSSPAASELNSVLQIKHWYSLCLHSLRLRPQFSSSVTPSWCKGWFRQIWFHSVSKKDSIASCRTSDYSSVKVISKSLTDKKYIRLHSFPPNRYILSRTRFWTHKVLTIEPAYIWLNFISNRLLHFARPSFFREPVAHKTFDAFHCRNKIFLC